MASMYKLTLWPRSNGLALACNREFAEMLLAFIDKPANTNIDWNDGMDSASVTPTISERTMTIHGCMAAVSSSITGSMGHSI